MENSEPEVPGPSHECPPLAPIVITLRASHDGRVEALAIIAGGLPSTLRDEKPETDRQI